MKCKRPTPGKRKRLTPGERTLIYNKFNGRCAYCGAKIQQDEMQVDHVIPLRIGGEDVPANMFPACRSCNHYKRGNSLEGWRKMLEQLPHTLERDCYSYRQAVRFGLVAPQNHKVRFWFELPWEYRRAVSILDR